MAEPLPAAAACMLVMVVVGEADITMALASRADMRGTERCCVRSRYTFATCKREQLPFDVPEALQQPTAVVLPQAAPPIRPTTISASPYLPSKR